MGLVSPVGYAGNILQNVVAMAPDPIVALDLNQGVAMESLLYLKGIFQI